MNIFIDCGAYDGDTIEEFKNWSKVAFPDKSDWHIYAFEPNPKFYKTLSERTDIQFSNKAVWIKDEQLTFSVDLNDTPLGSSLMESKNTYERGQKIKVQAIDFSEWLKQFKNDFVVVKCDIEGAEFKVLEKMVADETDKIPYVLMVEFHPNKVSQYTTEDKNKIIRKLQKRGVNIKEWH